MSYIVAVTSNINGGIPCNLKDHWTYHEDFDSAKAQYESMLGEQDTYTVSLTMVLESSDYPTHEGLKNVAY